MNALVDTLAGKDAAMQTLAAQILVKMGAAAVPRLSHLLGAAHPLTRQRIAELRGESRRPSVPPR